jgi:hypothetical protein
MKLIFITIATFILGTNGFAQTFKWKPVIGVNSLIYNFKISEFLILLGFDRNVFTF